MDHQFRNLKIISMSGSVKADIDVEFESERNVFYDFFKNFSGGVGDMTISWQTLKCLFTVDKRKIQRFQVENRLEPRSSGGIITPITLSVCESLVCLKLNDFESLSLPCLKTMFLEDVMFPSDAAAETLISCSPVLEVLKISLSRYHVVVALRVCSQSLKRASPDLRIKGGHAVVIDTPRLEYLSLMDYQPKIFKDPRHSSLCQLEVVQVALTPNPLLDWCVYTKPDRF